VRLIGNDTVYNHEGLERAALKHPSHTTFHKTPVSPFDEAAGITHFERRHINAALYELNPPKVAALYVILVPQSPRQTCRYDDGTGDELPVPLGTTAFVLGKELQSVAVRGTRCTRTCGWHPPPHRAQALRSRVRTKSLL
jgi:hypothetical protein